MPRGRCDGTGSHERNAGVPRAEAALRLRIQWGRHGDGGSGAIPPDYRRQYGLTVDRAAGLEADVPVMHPGPMNRGVEIDSEVADDPARSVIMQQVTHGVAVRMAVLNRAIAG